MCIRPSCHFKECIRVLFPLAPPYFSWRDNASSRRALLLDRVLFFLSETVFIFILIDSLDRARSSVHRPGAQYKSTLTRPL